MGAVKDIEFKKTLLNTLQEKLYQVKQKQLHVEEIMRLAGVQFARLREKPGSGLLPEDLEELEKWMGRARTLDGFRDIVAALRELYKYTPSGIKSNLYALVQKIIIEGPYRKKR